MARPQQAGETKAPVVIALAFFVLTTLALGVLTYMSYDQLALAKANTKKAEEDAKAATKLRSEDQDLARVYKVALGIHTQEEFDSLKATTNKEVVRTEYTNLMDGIKNKLSGTPQAPGGLLTEAQKQFVGGGGIVFDVAPKDVISWIWPANADMDREPDKTILAAIVNSYAQRKLGELQLIKNAKELNDVKQAYVDSTVRAKAEEGVFKTEAAKYPEQVKTIQTDANKSVDDIRTTYKDSTNRYLKDLRDKQAVADQKDVNITQLQAQVESFKARVNSLEAQLELKEDPFAFDKPHGKILRRKGNIVDIDLGSADNVRTGLTFSVQPADTPDRGLASRIRPKKDATGRDVVEYGPDGKPHKLMEIVPKGTIEVIEVLGPNISQCRIVSESSSIREGILVSDVLYNAAWRKGSADHVALFGVFDIDGDGIDDIKQVVRDLNRMGVVVDAYFNLETKKWEGKLTEQTIYAIEGYYPSQGSVDALAGAKSALDLALREAKTQCKEKGAKVVKIRDFFPRIGYRVKLDISGDTINRAYNRYLSVVPVNEAEAPK